MLLVPWKVGFAVLFQPQVEGTLLMTNEALVREHIGLLAMPLNWLHEQHKNLYIDIASIENRKLDIPETMMTIMPVEVSRLF